MDPLHIIIALGPVAIYLLLLGLINLSSRPFLTTGARDAAALSVAICGFAVAGPMGLFLPLATAERYGPYVWLLLLMFYGLCVTLIALMMRPRLVIYNISAEQVRAALASVVPQLDPEARWAGDSVSLPRLGVHLNVEPFHLLRNVQLVSAGPRQSYAGWRRLEYALADALREQPVARHPAGLVLTMAGSALGMFLSYLMARDTEGVAQALSEMLRL